MNIFGNRVFMIGDHVQYKGRGGTKRTKNNIWRVIEIVNDSNRYNNCPLVKVCLIKGLINDGKNHEWGPGYERYYFLKDLKHVEEA